MGCDNRLGCDTAHQLFHTLIIEVGDIHDDVLSFHLFDNLSAKISKAHLRIFVTGSKLVFSIPGKSHHLDAVFCKLFDIDGDEIRLYLSDIDYVACSAVIRVAREKHQDIKRRLRQVQLLAQRLADGAVRKARLVGKFHTGVQLTHSAPFFLSF